MPKNVVIIGAGISGKSTAKNLLKSFKKKDGNITIISASNYQEWNIASTYFLANPHEHAKFIAPNSKTWTLPGVTYVFGKATSITKDAVQLDNNRSVPFDALVVAVGFTMPLIVAAPGQTLESRKAEISNAAHAIANASNILIAGGGAVGLELLGDLRETNSKAKYTLVVSGSVPLATSDEQYQQKVIKKLESWGVVMFTNDKVVSSDQPVMKHNTYTLQSGNKIAADVFIPAYNQGPATRFIADSKDMSDILNSWGNIEVNEYLQAKKNSAIFAVGCNDLGEPAAVPKLEKQAATVATNVAAFMKGASLSPHKDAMPTMKHPMAQCLGHNTYAFFEPGQMPPPLRCCCTVCGFPCCPLPCCWCCLPPCTCGWCCGPPEGRGTAGAMMVGLRQFPGKHFKGFGEAPKQESMG